MRIGHSQTRREPAIESFPRKRRYRRAIDRPVPVVTKRRDALRNDEGRKEDRGRDRHDARYARNRRHSMATPIAQAMLAR